MKTYRIIGKLNNREKISSGYLFKELKVDDNSVESPECITLNYPSFVSLKLLNQQPEGYSGEAGYDYPQLESVVLSETLPTIRVMKDRLTLSNVISEINEDIETKLIVNSEKIDEKVIENIKRIFSDSATYIMNEDIPLGKKVYYFRFFVPIVKFEMFYDELVNKFCDKYTGVAYPYDILKTEEIPGYKSEFTDDEMIEIFKEATMGEPEFTDVYLSSPENLYTFIMKCMEYENYPFAIEIESEKGDETEFYLILYVDMVFLNPDLEHRNEKMYPYFFYAKVCLCDEKGLGMIVEKNKVERITGEHVYEDTIYVSMSKFTDVMELICNKICNDNPGTNEEITELFNEYYEQQAADIFYNEEEGSVIPEDKQSLLLRTYALLVRKLPYIYCYMKKTDDDISPIYAAHRLYRCYHV